jgi:hypothetical protein
MPSEFDVGVRARADQQQEEHVAAMPDLAFIKAGTLENTSWLNPTMEVWCETAQPWIDIDGTRQHAERNPPLAA